MPSLGLSAQNGLVYLPVRVLLLLVSLITIVLAESEPANVWQMGRITFSKLELANASRGDNVDLILVLLFSFQISSGWMLMGSVSASQALA